MHQSKNSQEGNLCEDIKNRTELDKRLSIGLKSIKARTELDKRLMKS